MTNNLDFVYDRLVADEKLKRGTKYERLTAIVFKILDSSAVVIHDVRLRAPGKKSVHQARKAWAVNSTHPLTPIARYLYSPTFVPGRVASVQSLAAEVSSDTACWRVLTPPGTCRCRGCWFASTPLPRPTGVRLSAALWLGPDGRSRCRSRGWCRRR